jgi:hypothetical protein
VNAIAVISANAVDDYQAKWPSGDCFFLNRPEGGLGAWLGALGGYTPQDFAVETQPDGTQIILTNVCDAVLRYTVLVTDTTKYSALFVLSLSWFLASFLAGPILKGEAGATEGERCMKAFAAFEGMAEASEANQRKTTVTPVASWIRGR